MHLFLSFLVAQVDLELIWSSFPIEVREKCFESKSFP